MKKKEIIERFCKLYKGEKTAPKKLGGLKQLIWDYERVWVDLQVSKNPILEEMVTMYATAGLANFNELDDTPISLKAILFNRYCYHSEDSFINNADGFKKWYIKNYTGAI